MRTFTLGQRRIGPGEPCYVIAEAGVNHNGNVASAHALVDRAAEAGADAVKFQAFVTDELVTPGALKASYQVATTGEGAQVAMLRSLELSEAEHAALKAHCEDAGVDYLCTPYEATSADMLERLGVAAYKVASTDATNLPFLRRLAGKGRPVLLSTGMCDLAEVEAALAALEAGGPPPGVAVLHCTSDYPAPVEQANLRVLHTLSQAFGRPVGFSDHTAGVGLSPVAVALGACVIEKHFTLDRAQVGPDHRASLEPAELTELVRRVRDVERALGDGVKRVAPAERANKLRMQKSLVARRRITTGQTLRPEDLTAKRPATGLTPSWLERIVGRCAAREVAADEVLTLDAVDWGSAPPG